MKQKTWRGDEAEGGSRTSEAVHTYPDILKTEIFFVRFQKKYALTRSVFEKLSPVHKKTTEIRSPAKNVKSRKKNCT